MAGLGRTFGRGAMTNSWNDIKNAKLIMVIGGNPAENHPSAMQYVNAARASGAKLLVIDPRRTRLAAQADYFLRVRPGTDIALIMGAVKNAIDKGYTASDAALGRWTDAKFKTGGVNNDYKRPSDDPTQAPTAGILSDSDSVWTALKNRVAPYTAAEVAKIVGGTESQVQAILDVIADSAVGRPLHPGTILYAMGGTQHSYGSQQIRSYAVIQVVLGNMGKAGGGVNAFRGIHNVQGSTDMGLLQALYPGYIATPGTKTYGQFMDTLFGNAKAGSPPYWTGLQQVGFKNLIQHYFRQTSGTPSDAEYSSGESNSNYDLLPKIAGLHHRNMFYKATTSGGATVKGMFILGQNPAVSEPNLPVIKAGLQNMEWLVVAEVFDSETASCTRKDYVGPADGVTWLLPACTFAEENGSISNSARWIQWRNHIDQSDPYVLDPKPNSKTDIEIITTLAYFLNQKGALIKGTHTTESFWADVWQDSSKSGYGWAFDGTYSDGQNPTVTLNQKTVAENIFKQMCSSRTTSDEYGSVWIYLGAYKPGLTNYGSADGNWSSHASDGILAKSRGNYDPAGKGLFPRWSWAWLVNRRVFYNNLASQGADGNGTDGTDLCTLAGRTNQANRWASDFVTFCATCPSKNVCRSPGDEKDIIVAPDKKSRLWLNTYSGSAGVTYATTYRAYPGLSDSWQAGSGSGADWRFPKHWEPWETPETALVTTYGKTGTAPIQSPGSSVDYPLILTTFRVTEHFNVGQTTRNSPWLAELVPSPVIEINSADAYTLGITNGANVFIDTPRASGIGPFKAVVGTGSQSLQRVKKGVVAIPWHWGNKSGIGCTGPSANEVTIDAIDVNAYMPEYKACLCRIHL